MDDTLITDFSIEPGAVVVGVDGTETAVRAAGWAAEEARLRGVDLYVLHAAPYASDPGARRRAGAILSRARTTARRHGPGVDVHGVLSRQPAVPALAAAARSAGLLVVGMITGTSPAEAVLGSLTPEVTAHARCPVVVVRGDAAVRPGPVVVGVDTTQADAAPLTAAFADAARHATAVVVVHCRQGHTSESRQELDDALSVWRAAFPGVPVEYRIGGGNPRDALLEQARAARLVVVGAHRHAAARVLFGSTSRELLRLCPVPLMVVRPVPAGDPIHAAPAGAPRDDAR